MFQKLVIINILLWTLLFALVGVNVISDVQISGILIAVCVVIIVLVTGFSYRYIFTQTVNLHQETTSIWRLWKPLSLIIISTFGVYVFLWKYSDIGSLVMVNGVILILLLYSVLYLAIINE